MNHLQALELIGKRWTGAILAYLLVYEGGVRYNHLLTSIEGISDRMLSERLAELGVIGLVVREVEAGPPIKIHYRLTAKGRALEPVLEAVQSWNSAAS